MALNPAPIAVFAYKRSEHLAQTFEALSKNKLADQSDLFVFCDGPKPTDSMAAIQKVRDLAKAQKWAKSIQVIEREKNMGLAKSMVAGVTQLCDQFGRVIVVEDDLLTNPHFLEFTNQSLELYKDDERVMQTTGYMYPTSTKGPDDAFFICHSSCWGWGTWKRAWDKFQIMDDDEYMKLKSKASYRRHFDMEHSYPYFKMLEARYQSKNDSWGIMWYLALFKHQGLIIMPRQTMVANIGRDATATHAGEALIFDQLTEFEVKKFPRKVEPDQEAYQAICHYLKVRHVPWYKSIVYKALDAFQGDL